jgi:uncharacterized repeat protein (TIGR03803 family)
MKTGWMKKLEAAVFALVLATIALATVPVHAQTYSALHDFGSRIDDPEDPTMGVIAQGRDGNLYSATGRGGAHKAGAVFKITPEGALTGLHSFCNEAKCADGAYPSGGLTLGTDGNFYGTAMGGGNQIDNSGCESDGGCGTIFRITPLGDFSVLYAFSDGSDGAGPAAPPVEGDDGNFYGTTTIGGAAQCGTIYKITPAGTFTSLYQFDDTHGCGPYGPLVLGTDGNFYGTAFMGGTSKTSVYPGFGTIFKITPAGKFSVLYNFDGAHGAYSYSPMIQGTNGDFYGTTSDGGFGGCNGVIFQITSSGSLTELYCINETTDGNYLNAGLVQATDGNFYGVAEMGGTESACDGLGCGTLFKVTSAGDYSVLYDFQDFSMTTGAWPEATPIQHTNGNIYGITDSGGIEITSVCDLGCGAFYEWKADLPAFVSLVPNSGKAGATVGILGQGFSSETTVSFNGKSAKPTSVTETYLTVEVPTGATTGLIKVSTDGTTLTSNKKFLVP